MKFYIVDRGSFSQIEGHSHAPVEPHFEISEELAMHPVEVIDIVEVMDEEMGQVRKEARLNAQKLKSKHDKEKADKQLRDLEEAEAKRIKAEAEKNVRDRSKRKSERATAIRDLVKNESELLKLIVEQLLDN
jgi:hypothetical protein